MKNRSLLITFLLLVLTFGVYSLYWVYSIHKGLNERVSDEWKTSAGEVIFFSIITLGIYYIYWFVKTAIRLDRLTGKNNLALMIVFMILFPLIGMLIMQNDINSVA